MWVDCFRPSGVTGVLLVVAVVNVCLFLVFLLHEEVLTSVYRKTCLGLPLDLMFASGSGIPNNRANRNEMGISYESVPFRNSPTY